MSNDDRNEDTFWQTKVAARLHDPAEKALVLMRDPGVSHEEGTVRDLRERLGIDKGGICEKRADRWASAADRPALPKKDWRLIWAEYPAIIHPLTGETLRLKPMDISAADAKARSLAHHQAFLDAILPNGQSLQSEEAARRVLFALWRFAPERMHDESDEGRLGWLWQQLPADTRIPSHSIWDHLDLVSAFAGAFAADPKNEAALLTMAIGTVQSFIAAARSTSDLWAGSHLLSRLAWETMRPICEALGPDAILFPRLRGIPQVDLWLRDQMDLPESLFKTCEWMIRATDANPLFSAALPNRFVALVPASSVKILAEKAQNAVRDWLQNRGQETVARLLREADYDVENTTVPYEQMEGQLQGFPETHWAAIPFSLIRTEEKEKIWDITRLKAAMSPFFGVEANEDSGFLKTPVWQVLQKDIAGNDGTSFYTPNPGVLYPAIYELADRALAAAKSVRGFAQKEETGWRCSLTGEAEWLTTDREQLKKSYRRQPQPDTLWARIAKKHPSWAKKGEHLSALPAIKRLWPTIFREEVGKALNPEDNGQALDIPRFVISTHTMALAHQLEYWLNDNTPAAILKEQAESVALPRKLVTMGAKPEKLALAKRLPGLLEDARESDGETALKQAQDTVKDILGIKNIETYYALIMMDGDRMGAMLSGEHETQMTYAKSFHPEIRARFQQYAEDKPRLKDYLNAKRAVSPAQHMAISSALHDFSQTIVPHVVEMEHSGKTLYAGGDDVLAMLPVADLLTAMMRLRKAYSGLGNEDKNWQDTKGCSTPLICKKGFAALGGRLMRMMGDKATASCGAVIAHHQAPLNTVMRELRAAEKRAKNKGGRDAFSITVIKRSGGTLRLTAKWGETLEILKDLVGFLRAKGVSRRAVYNTLEWLKDLPEPKDAQDLAEKMLAQQFSRQVTQNDAAKAKVPDLARHLIQLAANVPVPIHKRYSNDFLYF